jgi:hypothetical protein
MDELRSLTINDIQQAKELSDAEGWNQTDKDWQLLVTAPGNVSLAFTRRRRMERLHFNRSQCLRRGDDGWHSYPGRCHIAVRVILVKCCLSVSNEHIILFLPHLALKWGLNFVFSPYQGTFKFYKVWVALCCPFFFFANIIIII